MNVDKLLTVVYVQEKELLNLLLNLDSAYKIESVNKVNTPVSLNWTDYIKKDNLEFGINNETKEI